MRHRLARLVQRLRAKHPDDLDYRDDASMWQVALYVPYGKGPRLMRILTRRGFKVYRAWEVSDKETKWNSP